MAVSVSSRNHTPGHESISSRNSDIGDTVVVRAGSSDDSSSSSNRSSPNEEIQTATSHTPSSNFPISGQENTHKRKRSGLDEGERSPSRRTYDYSPPKKVEHPEHVADRALHVLDTSNSNGPDYYVNGNDTRTDDQEWDDRHSQQPQAGTVQTPNGDEQQRWESNSNGQTYGHESINGTNGVPKRKRNFSNRTKTGCMTCRKRKKKCDEARPHCMNCLRGSFTCEGYSTTRTSGLWSKPPTVKAPVPLQSKEGHVEVEIVQQSSTNNSPSSRRPYDGGAIRPLPVEGHDQPHHHYATTPSTETRNRPPYAGQPWPPQQGLPQYTRDQLPPMSDYSRTDNSGNTHSRDMSRPPTQGTSAPPLSQTPPHPPQQQQPPPPTSAPPQPYPPPAASAPPPQAPPPQQSYYPQQEYRSTYAPPPQPQVVEYTSSTGHSRVSSSGYDRHVPTSMKRFTMEDVERSRMLRGTQYNHLDKTLINERQRCERALTRYNASMSIDSGMDLEEARNMLWKVFDPSRDTTHHFLARVDEKGVLGHAVHIEAPFACTYGYNLKIMDNVFIGKGTTIDDAAGVEIGARTWIGPNVTILTSECVKDLVDRRGSGGTWTASKVFIGSEVVIGAGAVIYPGIRLERGVTVEPFAIVKQSCRENEIVEAHGGQRRQL